MKAWLVSQRIRSRDLLDLMSMLQHGRTLQDILDAETQADPTYHREYAKEVLVGNVPLDAVDEGFDLIGIGITIEDIHRYFLEAVNRYEVGIARMIRQPMEYGLSVRCTTGSEYWLSTQPGKRRVAFGAGKAIAMLTPLNS